MKTKVEDQMGDSAMKKFPVIVAAMTKQDFKKLEKPGQEIHDLLGMLNASGIECTNDCYGQERKEWRPFGKNGETIETFITETIKLHEQEYGLCPDFSLSEALLSRNKTTRGTAWRELKKNGWCFLVIDGVSVYDPHIRETITKSVGVDSDRVAIAVLSPVNAMQHPVNEHLLGFLEEIDPFNFRYQLYYDPKVDFLTGDTTCLRRWLRLNLERMSIEMEEIERRIRERKAALIRDYKEERRGYEDVV